MLKNCGSVLQAQRETTTVPAPVALEKENSPTELQSSPSEPEQPEDSCEVAPPSLNDAFHEETSEVGEKDKATVQGSREKANDLRLAGGLPSGWHVWSNSRFIVAMQKHIFRERFSGSPRECEEDSQDRELAGEDVRRKKERKEIRPERGGLARLSALGERRSLCRGRKERTRDCRFSEELEEGLWREGEREREEREMILCKKGFYSISFWRILGLYRNYSEMRTDNNKEERDGERPQLSHCRLGFASCVSSASSQSYESGGVLRDLQGQRRQQGREGCPAGGRKQIRRKQGRSNSGGDREIQDPGGWRDKQTRQRAGQSVGGQEEEAKKEGREQDKSEGEATQQQAHEQDRGHDRLFLVLSAKQRRITGRRGCACGVLLVCPVLFQTLLTFAGFILRP